MITGLQVADACLHWLNVVELRGRQHRLMRCGVEGYEAGSRVTRRGQGLRGGTRPDIRPDIRPNSEDLALTLKGYYGFIR